MDVQGTAEWLTRSSLVSQALGTCTCMSPFIRQKRSNTCIFLVLPGAYRWLARKSLTKFQRGKTLAILRSFSSPLKRPPYPIYLILERIILGLGINSWTFISKILIATRRSKYSFTVSIEQFHLIITVLEPNSNFSVFEYHPNTRVFG